MGNISISVDDKSLREWLSKATSKANDLSSVMSMAAGIMERDIVEHFDQRRDSTGAEWPELSINYSPNKGEMLQRTGNLRQQMVKSSSKFNAQVSNGVVYAGIHNFGGTIPARKVAPKDARVLAWVVGEKSFFSKGHTIPTTKIPKREFMYISEPAIDRIAKAIENEIPD